MTVNHPLPNKTWQILTHYHHNNTQNNKYNFVFHQYKIYGNIDIQDIYNKVYIIKIG